MIYRFPSNEMLQNNDRYRIEGGYDQPSQWIIQTKIAPVECRIISDNVASIYSNYFYDQVKRRFVFLKIILFYLVSL
jgi:hypothetical protein